MIDLDIIEARFAILFVSENEETYNKWYRDKINSEKEKRHIGWLCLADCILDGRRYESEEEILISEHGEDYDWPGTVFFDRHPDEFEAIYKD